MKMEDIFIDTWKSISGTLRDSRLIFNPGIGGNSAENIMILRPSEVTPNIASSLQSRTVIVDRFYDFDGGGLDWTDGSHLILNVEVLGKTKIFFERSKSDLKGIVVLCAYSMMVQHKKEGEVGRNPYLVSW